MSSPAEIKLYPLKSSYLDRIGWDEPTQTLHVIFKDGTHWSYRNVSHAKFSALLKADSPGNHFHNNIRGHHHATKVS
jgi:hypothetical protein